MIPRELQKVLQRLSKGDVGTGALFSEIARTIDNTSLLQDIGGTKANQLENDLRAVTLLRAVLNLIPAAAVENPKVKSRPLIEKRLQRLTGTTPDNETVESLLSITKRMQRYATYGRSASSLVADRVSHVALLKSQNYRCACCGYRFKERDLFPDPSSGESPSTDHPKGANDRSPLELHRRAVLDHILPVYLAGDESGNHQVLCQTCNSGKGDLLLGFDCQHWFGLLRPRELTKVRSQQFYAVLARDDFQCTKTGLTSRQSELRVCRKDEEGPDLITNLRSISVDEF